MRLESDEQSTASTGQRKRYTTTIVPAINEERARRNDQRAVYIVSQRFPDGG
jgi:hypothetical protein